MKTKLLIFAIVPLLLFNASCKKKERVGGPGGSEESHSDILARTSQSMQTDLSELVSSEGAEALITLINYFEFGVDDFEGANLRTLKSADFRKRAKRKANAFKTFFTPHNKSTAENEPMISLEEFSGEYRWNSTQETWDRVRDTDKLILHFPASEGSTRNNATLSWTAFETQKVPDAMHGVTDVPVRIVAQLTIDGKKYVEVDYLALYSPSGVPLSLKYSMYLKPFRTTFEFNDKGREVSFVTGMEKDGYGSIWEVKGSSTFKDNEQSVVDDVHLSARYGELKMNVSVDASGAMDDPNQEDELHLLETYFNLDFRYYPSNRLIGELFWSDDDGVLNPHIRYANGETEPLLHYMDPIFDDMEGVITENEVARVREKVNKKIKR
ncbi:hypothetical protein RCC89_04515 [Cytophagaceae bacterium ABcell3]|nr:hypothetical protein RCC89_04515 [Cytophagaceae bacterium ABcell3]